MSKLDKLFSRDVAITKVSKSSDSGDSPDIYIERAANGDTILLNKLIYKPIKSTYEKDSKIIVWKAELSTTIINDNKTTSYFFCKSESIPATKPKD